MRGGVLSDVLMLDPPEVLYHYTTLGGLLGIVSSAEMWMTHTQFLNDQQEYRHAIKLALDELEAAENNPDTNCTEKRHRQLELMWEGIRHGVENVNVCVCSFSEDRDSLPQWRAYGDTSARFAVGFSGNVLKEAASRVGFLLTRCIYDESRQRELLRDLIRHVLEYSDDDTTERYIVPRFAADLHRYAPILKHSSFSEEHEWRIISKVLQPTDQRFTFRPGRSMLVPYYRLPIPGEGQRLSLSEIVVGPTPCREQSAVSVGSLLESQQIDSCRVNVSAVPYRNW